MNNFMTTKEAADKWDVTQRQVQKLCKSGIIPGVEMFNGSYMIPVDAQRPVYGFHFETKDVTPDNK